MSEKKEWIKMVLLELENIRWIILLDELKTKLFFSGGSATTCTVFNSGASGQVVLNKIAFTDMTF